MRGARITERDRLVGNLLDQLDELDVRIRILEATHTGLPGITAGKLAYYDEEGDQYLPNDLRVEGGLYVGATDQDPDDDEITADGDMHVGGGLYVGGVAYDPPADDIVADGGIYLGRQADPGDGNVAFTGALKSYKNATEYTGYTFVPLTSPLTSSSWNGDSYSTTAKTLIDLSSVFSAPAGIKAALFVVAIQDSGAGGSDCFLILSPNNTANQGPGLSCLAANDRWSRGLLVVPCDASGNVYYQIGASGSNTLDAYVEIWGYWI